MVHGPCAMGHRPQIGVAGTGCWIWAELDRPKRPDLAGACGSKLERQCIGRAKVVYLSTQQIFCLETGCL